MSFSIANGVPGRLLTRKREQCYREIDLVKSLGLESQDGSDAIADMTPEIWLL